MIIRLKIDTPTGKAQSTGEYIQKWIIGDHAVGRTLRRGMGKKKMTIQSWGNEEDDELYMEIECEAREYIKILNNVNRFDWVIKQIFSSKLIKKRIDETPEQLEELRRILENDTKIEVIKAATAEEMVEAVMTWWQRMKKKNIKRP